MNNPNIRQFDASTDTAIEAAGRSSLDMGLQRMEMDLAMEHAMRNPRNIEVVIKKIRAMALYNDAAAHRCIYALPRKEKAIMGPSIGFAKIILTAWRNSLCRAWFVGIDKTNKMTFCEGAFKDLESNVTSGRQIGRRISGRDGRLYNDDMIGVTTQACMSIAYRSAILMGVPDPIYNPILEEAKIIIRGTTATLPERRQKMIALFANFGVAPDRVFMALGVKDEKEITLDQMVMLRGMYEQLRDEEITAAEMFDPRKMVGMGFEQTEIPLGDDEVPAVPRQAGPAGNGTAAPSRPVAMLPREAVQKPEPAAMSVTMSVTAVGQESFVRPPVAEPPHAQDAPGEAADASEGSPMQDSGEGPKAAERAPLAAGGPSQFHDRPYVQRTGDEYVAYCVTWIDGEKTKSGIDDRWKKERRIRNALGTGPLNEEQLAAVNGAKAQAAARIERGAQ